MSLWGNRGVVCSDGYKHRDDIYTNRQYQIIYNRKEYISMDVNFVYGYKI